MRTGSSSSASTPATTPALYAQDGKGLDAIVHAHYFVGPADWWVTEYSPAEDEAFGFVCTGHAPSAEFAYIAMAALEQYRLPLRILGLPRSARGPAAVVEYETHWTPQPLREALAATGRFPERLARR